MTSRPPWRPPGPIGPDHRLDGFDCGNPILDGWLRERALRNEGRASRTFVVADGLTVVGFHSLATASILRGEMPRAHRHGLPDPVPALLLGRLAVDRRHAGQGIGADLLRDAMLRTADVSRQVGLRALIVHAIDDKAVRFYARHGFQVLSPGTRTLFLPIETVLDAVTHA